MSRRRFLELAGVSLAGCGLMAACGRAVGSSDGDAGPDPLPDAGYPGPDSEVLPQPDAYVDLVDAEVPDPGCYIHRIPATGDLLAYLLESGECSFYVKVYTCSAASFQALTDNPVQAQQACRMVISGFDYDTLDTAQGVAQAEDELLTALDELCQQLNGHSETTIDKVVLIITYLDPDPTIMGIMASPEYPWPIGPPA